jgi:ribosome maturation factor RimP
VLKPEILTLIKDVVAETGYGLAYVDYVSGKNSTLVVALENTDGSPVTLGDCEKVSRRLSTHLDILDPIKNAYQLEVSSPGLDRPLFTVQDYEKFQGHAVKLTLKMPRDGQKRFQGKLLGVKEDVIQLHTDEEESLSIPLSEIHRCKLIPIL